MRSRSKLQSLCALLALATRVGSFNIRGNSSPESSCPFLDAGKDDPHLNLLCAKSSSSNFTASRWSDYVAVFQRFQQDVYNGHVPENGMLFSAKTFSNGAFEGSRYVMFAHFTELQTLQRQTIMMEIMQDLAVHFNAPQSVLDW